MHSVKSRIPIPTHTRTPPHTTAVLLRSSRFSNNHYQPLQQQHRNLCSIKAQQQRSLFSIKAHALRPYDDPDSTPSPPSSAAARSSNRGYYGGNTAPRGILPTPNRSASSSSINGDTPTGTPSSPGSSGRRSSGTSGGFSSGGGRRSGALLQQRRRQEPAAEREGGAGEEGEDPELARRQVQWRQASRQRRMLQTREWPGCWGCA